MLLSPAKICNKFLQKKKKKDALSIDICGHLVAVQDNSDNLADASTATENKHL